MPTSPRYGRCPQSSREVPGRGAEILAHPPPRTRLSARRLASLEFRPGARSSAGQSTSLTPRGSPVRVGPRPSDPVPAHAVLSAADDDRRLPHPHRRDRLGPGRVLRGRPPPEGLERADRGRYARAPADAVGARPLWGRSRPSEDQVGHARLREDRCAPALPVLRQHHLRRARLPRGAASALPRGRLRDRLAA